MSQGGVLKLLTFTNTTSMPIKSIFSCRQNCRWHVGGFRKLLDGSFVMSWVMNILKSFLSCIMCVWSSSMTTNMKHSQKPLWHVFTAKDLINQYCPVVASSNLLSGCAWQKHCILASWWSALWFIFSLLPVYTRVLPYFARPYYPPLLFKLPTIDLWHISRESGYSVVFVPSIEVKNHVFVSRFGISQTI